MTSRELENRRRGPIAIHVDRRGYAASWIDYCSRHGIAYRRVNCYANDIVEQLHECPGLLWQWNHLDSAAAVFARSLAISLERSGKLAFPNFDTCWHYDDKVGQKYLLESLGFSSLLVDSYVFYSETEALAWASSATTTFPKVFKLRGGAGSENVVLVHGRRHAEKLIHRSFRSGWSDRRRFASLRERLWRFRRDRTVRTFLEIGLGIGRSFVPKKGGIQIGYAYFQDFISGNTSDVRVVVIGARAFALTRRVRAGDFRASGSGIIDYDPAAIPIDCVKLSFEIAAKTRMQSAAFDYVFEGGKPRLIELSYAFTAGVYWKCPGYWTPDLVWHEAAVRPEEFIIEDFCAALAGGAPQD